MYYSPFSLKYWCVSYLKVTICIIIHVFCEKELCYNGSMIKDFTDKVFILEGPDGGGKSTLAKKLSDTYGIDYTHLTYYKDEEMMRTQFYDVIRRINTEKRGLVVDRFILSNLAYGIVFHNFSFVNGWKMFLDALCRDWLKGKEIVICLPYDK